HVDEDTLSELDGVPTVQTAVAGPVPAPQPAPKRRHVPLRAWIAIAVVVVAVAVGLGVFGLSRANFVGADDNGYVAVYQGVPWNLPFGIHLYREVWVSKLLAAQLSSEERKRLFDHSLVDRSTAENKVKELERDVVP